METSRSSRGKGARPLVRDAYLSYRDFNSFGMLRASAILSKCDDFLDDYLRKTNGVDLGKEWDFVLRRASVEFYRSVELGSSLTQLMRLGHLGETSFSIDYLFSEKNNRSVAASIVYVSISAMTKSKVVTPPRIRSFIVEIG